MTVMDCGRKIYLTEYEEDIERALQVVYNEIGGNGFFDCIDGNCEFCPFCVTNHPTGVRCEMEDFRNEVKRFLDCIKTDEGEEDYAVN